MRAHDRSRSLMPSLDEERLQVALRQCALRSPATGADATAFERLRRESAEILPRLARDLAEGTWRPGPPTLTHVSTYTGKQLEFWLPPVLDQVVHRAVRNAVDRITETRVLRDWVSGYRPGRSRVTTLRHAARLHARGLRAVADVEAAPAGEARLEEVVGWLTPYIRDDAFLTVLRTALSVFPDPTAPGTTLAPMLVNLRLSRCDTALDGPHMIRFGRTYLAFTTDHGEAERAFTVIAEALHTRGLQPHPGSRVRTAVNVEDLLLNGR
ncbi:Retron-type reverse transcriptase [Actinosynnema sp. NPDC020468]|uniref:Retron-type reverse transcriptase n=1 Tax=Actinosynnema sp. NPDC020468 TaxID=3154488 RepID=UPI00340E90CD